VFVHFTDRNGRILFQNDHSPTSPTSQWKSGVRSDGPFRLRTPEELPSQVQIRIGLFQPASGRRARLRGPDDGEARKIVGRLQRVDDRLVFAPADSTPSRPPRDPARFVRAHQGWAEGLHPLDRFLKNTHEILGPLNALTAQIPMTRFEFLTKDFSVRQTGFGEGENSVNTIVNLSDETFATQSAVGGTLVLPPGGFLVESPTFIAFCATTWSGKPFTEPTLFTLRSLDGRPLTRSSKVSVFHGFGDPNLPWRGQRQTVRREVVLQFN
jgi:hypothetical protein